MLLPRRDQRKARRRPMRRAALVSFVSASKPFPCVVWDMSEGGARLAIACPSAGVPHEFHLLLTGDGSVRRNCEVVWKNTRFVGVKFR
jgi:PilZ domain